jgi:hypothetical protein
MKYFHSLEAAFKHRFKNESLCFISSYCMDVRFSDIPHTDSSNAIFT